MTPRRGPILAVLALLLGGACAVLAWLPWNPLEDDAGRLDLLLPPDLELVVRLQPDAALDSAAGRTLWEHPVTVSLREDLAVEERLLAPLRRIEATLAELTRGIGARPTVRGDLFGRDVLIGLRAGELLIVSRMSGRSRALDIVRRIDAADLAAHGLRLDGDIAVFESDDLPPVHAARYRDVLVLSTSREMVTSAVARGAAKQDEAADDDAAHTPYTSDLVMDRAPGSRVLFQARPSRLVASGSSGDDPAEHSEPEDALGMWRAIFPPGRLGVCRGEIDLMRPERVPVRISGEYEGALPEPVAALPPAVEGGARALRAEALRYALPSEALVVTGVGVRAEDAVRALVDAQPRERRELFDDVLADEGTSVAGLAARFARHLEDGAGFVVARLDEVDSLELDDPVDGGQAHPIPATLVVFRLRDPSGAELLLDLQRWSGSLFGAPLAMTPASHPGGARLYAPESHGFGAMWRLLTPSCAIVDGHFVFSTNQPYLERALRYRASTPPPAIAGSAGRTATASLHGDALRRYVADQRWEWAHQRTYHDWKAERQAIRRDLDAVAETMSAADRMSFEDNAIDERIAVRNDIEFPAALAEYRQRWAPLDVLGDVTIDATLTGRAFEIRLDLGLRRP